MSPHSKVQAQQIWLHSWENLENMSIHFIIVGVLKKTEMLIILKRKMEIKWNVQYVFSKYKGYDVKIINCTFNANMLDSRNVLNLITFK